MKSYGIISKPPNGKNQNYHIEEIYNKGFTIMENQIKDSMPLLRKKIKSIYQKQIVGLCIKDLEKIGDLNI